MTNGSSPRAAIAARSTAGWMMLGAHLHASDGRFTDARHAFGERVDSNVDDRLAAVARHRPAADRGDG